MKKLFTLVTVALIATNLFAGFSIKWENGVTTIPTYNLGQEITFEVSSDLAADTVVYWAFASKNAWGTNWDDGSISFLAADTMKSVTITIPSDLVIAPETRNRVMIGAVASPAWADRVLETPNAQYFDAQEVVVSTVAVEAEELSVFPNPADAVVTVAGVAGDVVIYNAAGVEVKTGIAGEAISVADLAAGFYIVVAGGQSQVVVVE